MKKMIFAVAAVTTLLWAGNALADTRVSRTCDNGTCTEVWVNGSGSHYTVTCDDNGVSCVSTDYRKEQ